MSDELDLDAIRARADAATEGPWQAVERADGGGWHLEDIERFRGYRNNVFLGEDGATAEFIAHAREDVPALLTEVERLRAEVTFWREQQQLAASVAAGLADLDETGTALRQMLRQEKDRRQQAEDELDRLRYAELLRADAAAVADDDVSLDAGTVELAACAWEVVHAAERMRMQWAETTDPGQRNRELWTPLHTAADVLRDRLEVVAPPQLSDRTGWDQP